MFIRFFATFSILILLNAPMIWADDAPLALFGETLVPIKSTAIQLVSEDVNVYAHVSKADAPKHAWPDDAIVSAILRFKNPTGKDVTLLIGFPIDKQFANSEDGDYILAEKLNFHVEVNGQVVKPRIFVDDKQKRLWYVWEQKFPANRTIHIKHTYWLYWGGDHIPPDIYNIRYFQYILSTGALWADSIEKATVTIHFDEPLEPKFYYSLLKPNEKSNRHVRWHFENFKPKSEVVFAYSWAENKKALVEYLQNIDKRAKTEAQSVVRELQGVSEKVK